MGVTALRAAVTAHCDEVLLIGEAAHKLHEALDGACRLSEAGTLEAAVQMAAQRAEPGQVVLLSPACASFDQFASYEDRGEAFRRAVTEWVQR